MIRRPFLVFALTVLTLGFASQVFAPSRAEALEGLAWGDALDAVKATPAERAGWVRPPTVHFDLARFQPMSPDGCPRLAPGQVCVARICGMTEVFLTVGPDGSLVWTAHSATYLRPSEFALLRSVLKHEYLHFIWMRKGIADPAFAAAHEDSEEWVRTLAPVICPNR